MPGHELPRVAAWWHDTLTAAAAALVGDNVYQAAAPTELAPPPPGQPRSRYVTFQTQAGPSGGAQQVTVIGRPGTNKLGTVSTWLVKAVADTGPGAYAAAAELADALEAALEDPPYGPDPLDGTVTVAGLARLGPVAYPEPLPNGRLVWHLGALWRADTNPTPA